MSMKQIETLVFDYGGVIVNIDDASVVKAMESLGVTAFKRLIHVSKIKRLMHQYINGLVAEAETLKEMLSLCRKGTTTEDIEKVLEELCGNLPVERLEALVKLRKRYKIYLLSNINDTLWQKSVSLMKQLGYSTDELFDEVFLSYAMRKEKPSIEIYEEMTQKTGLNPATTLYFDDRAENGSFYRVSIWARVLASSVVAEVRPPYLADESRFLVKELSVHTRHFLHNLALPFP